MRRVARLSQQLTRSMSSYVIPPPPQASLAVHGTDSRFPVRRIFCVGRNYWDHAVEMGDNPERDPPFYFCKPADAVVDAVEGAKVPYPSATDNFHYEFEMVLAIGRAGRDISIEAAREHVYGYAVGIDLTRRDLQSQAKDKKRPWDAGKAFDFSAPCSPLVTAAPPADAKLWGKVNDKMVQESSLDKMIWSTEEVVSNLSTLFELRPGDLIMTGTPANVGKLHVGDKVHGGVDGLVDCVFEVV